MLNSFNLVVFSPLEQFEILPLLQNFLGLGLTITNETIILILFFSFIFLFFNSSVNQNDKSLYVIPHRWQVIIEIIYKMILAMVTDNISGNKSQYFFPLVFTLFFFIVNLNLIGLVPYSFTLTSHLIVTFSLSVAVFVGINIVCFRIHGLEFFSLFFPAGTSLALGLLLVPVEIMSYFFRPISLAVRLFANMMAGHTLLKVFAGFAWTLMGCSGILFFTHFVPLIVLLPLIGLELGVALIQAFVFSILTCIYLNDAINLH